MTAFKSSYGNEYGGCPWEGFCNAVELAQGWSTTTMSAFMNTEAFCLTTVNLKQSILVVIQCVHNKLLLLFRILIWIKRGNLYIGED